VITLHFENVITSEEVIMGPRFIQFQRDREFNLGAAGESNTAGYTIAIYDSSSTTFRIYQSNSTVLKSNFVRFESFPAN
jgi:hypothetical protein